MQTRGDIRMDEANGRLHVFSLKMQCSEPSEARHSVNRVAKYMFAVAVFMVLYSATAKTQAEIHSDGDMGIESVSSSTSAEQNYVRPTGQMKIKNYVFDAFGPYPIVGSAFAAGISQWGNAPPEWHQGMEGYGKRIGSSYVVAAVGITTRYALAQLLREDTKYYRCECSGTYSRMRYAVVSAVMARRGRDGERVFSLSALVAPYAGTTVAVYAWYPGRYGAKDAIRMGSYNLLAVAGGNLLREFLSRGSHSLMTRMHINGKIRQTYSGGIK